MEMQELAQDEGHYEPTANQAARAAQLRKFNRLFIYLPIGLMAAIAVAVVVVLLIIAINPPSEEALVFISGLADVALVIAMLPVLVIGAILIGLIGYGYTEARKNGTAPVRQTQILLWRMDNLIGRIRIRTSEVADVVAQPFLKLNGAIAYARELVSQLIGMVKRS